MHPLRKLRESGHATVEQNKALLAEDVVFHSPVLVKAVTGRDAAATIFATSASVREGRYVAEHKLDDRTTFLWWKGTIDGHEIESSRCWRCAGPAQGANRGLSPISGRRDLSRGSVPEVEGRARPPRFARSRSSTKEEP